MIPHWRALNARMRDTREDLETGSSFSRLSTADRADFFLSLILNIKYR